MIAVIILILIILLTGITIYVLSSSSPTSQKPDSKKPNSICIVSDRILKNTPTSKLLNIPARRMWGWGSYADNEIGYCGESAVQQALIYYGNYISQAQVNKASGGSFLPGLTSTLAYRRLQVLYDDCDVGSNWNDLSAYIKRAFDNNYPIVAGLFVLEDGDVDYDHICVMYGYETNDKGELTKFIYNDAYQLESVNMDCTLDSKGNPNCWKTRTQYNNSSDSASAALLPCNLPNVSGKKDPDGSPATENLSSIQGNVDPLGELFPVMLEMGNPYEANWGSEDQVFAPAIPIDCVAHISCLEIGQQYSLIRFDNPDDLPVEGLFLAYATWTLRVNFTATSDTYDVKVTNTHDYPFMSNGTYFFRCVLNTDVNNQVNSVYSLGSNLTNISPDFIAPPTPEPALRGYVTKKLRPRRKNKFRNRSYIEYFEDSPMFGNECISEKPTKSTGIVCTNGNDNGSIATYWNWHFPAPFKGWKNAPNPGCVQLIFTPTQRALDEYPCCMKFSISTVNSKDAEIFSPTDSKTDPDSGDDNDGFIGLDGRMYIGCDELQVFMAFSLTPVNPDGSYTMVSADGVTISTLVPVNGQ